jgi:hypothetical protein
MGAYMFSVIAEAGSDDYAFALAKAAQPELLLGRDRYVILDGRILYPSDRHSYERAEDVFGVQPQAGVPSIAGPGMNTCWAQRILPLQNGRRRLHFFGLVSYRCNPVTVGPARIIDPGPDHTSTIYTSLGGM